MSTPLCLPKGMVVVTSRSKSSVSMVTSYNKALVSQLVTPIFEILMSDHYAALGLASSATLADIKKAYRQKAAFYHPDRNDAEDAAERFRAVQSAYDV
jgi:DnaJ-domain-containing protein 1